MNLFDLALILLLVLAVAGGLRVGLLTRAFTWLGLAIGILAATRTVPFALGLFDEATAGVRFVVAVATLAVTLSVFASVLGSFGARLRRGLGGSTLSRLDRVAGALAGVAVVAGLTWFLLPTAADVPGQVAREVRTSTAATLARTVAPPPPNAARALRGLVASTRFPEVLTDLSPTPATDPPPTALEVPDDVVERATAATVRVSSSGCARRYEGSGVTVEPDTVLTNAHVVAGADEVTLRRPDGEQLPADVVVFDPDRDLAVLRAEGLGQDPLPLGESETRSRGFAVGYPGGTNAPRVAPLRVEERRSALGRDIYGVDETQREVLFLSADLEQGDSGSPVVDAEGAVVGLVFAVGPDRPSTAFALDREELDAVLGAERVTGASGRCL
jgi:hypothetical protein